MTSTANEQIDFSILDEILKNYDYKKPNLIAILQKTQEHFRYLPVDAMTYIAVQTGMSPATVYGVATFYSQFSLDPKGKYEIKVCDGTACHVRGSMPVLDLLRKRLHLDNGKFTTDDGLFTVETVSCLGACGLAPVVVINEKVYPKVTPEAMATIIDTLMMEER